MWKGPLSEGLARVAGKRDSLASGVGAWARAICTGLDGAETAALIVDSSASILAANRTFCSQAAPDATLGSALPRLLSSQMARALDAAFRGETTVVETEEVSWLRGTGARRVTLAPLSSPQQSSCVLLLIEPEELLLESPRRAPFHELVERSPEGIVAFTGDRMTYANPTATRMLGLPPSGDPGQFTWASLFQREHGAGFAAARGAVPAPGERTLVRADGADLPVELLAARTGPEQRVIFFREFAERDALRRELERDSRLQSLGRLAGSIAHDFNNLLTGIRGSLAVARSAHSASDDRDAALESAEVATQRAAEVARQLLTFARGDSPTGGSTDINQLVREVLQLTSRFAAGRCTIDVNLDPAAGSVRVASCQLHQVVLNLVLNAQDAVRGSAAIQVQTHGPGAGSHGGRGRFATIVVKDGGHGMDATTRVRIFEPFFTTKPAGKGTGLGLSTVYAIVRQAGGWVEVTSELGRGATFRVHIPTTSEGTESMGIESSTAERGQRKASVLICDDEARLASLTAGLLEEFGFDATTVSNGNDALALMAADQADIEVLLLDVNLATGPQASEVLRSMLEASIATPVILTSGFAAEDLPEGLRSHPRVVNYLAKPYSVDELVDTIRRAAPVTGSAHS